MKSVLLDESVPTRLVHALASPILTVRHAALSGYKGMPDKELLEIVASLGFNAFLTCDQSLPKQQNLSSCPFGVIVVCTNNWPTILANLGEIARELDQVEAGGCIATLRGAHLTRYGRKPRGSW